MSVVAASTYYRDYPYSAGGDALTHASEEAVWQVVSAIGGENRYYAMNGLWAIREWMDALVGGQGLTRKRPTGRPLQAGDQIDSWKVLIAEEPNLLALAFGMKAPGKGVLEFRVTPIANQTRITATAYWTPQGIAGKLYWTAMIPAHLVLFKRLTAEIARRAEKNA